MCQGPGTVAHRLALELACQVTKGTHGMREEHARPGIAHDLAYALAHLGGVAVVCAAFAVNLLGHAPTALRSQACVIVELLARGTDCLAALRLLRAFVSIVIAPTMQCDHLRDGSHLALALLLRRPLALRVHGCFHLPFVS